ncbi:transketolase [Aurantimonas coralicida]|uniref:transketolase n=1 Tax=Aurantimonas coralicida TaxID=182270 RepID=UPI003516BAE2
MDIAARRTANPDHWNLASAIRVLSMDAVEAANSGHPGMPMGMADVATVLFKNHLKFDASAPHWFDRDRFILSAGHGSMLIYSLLHLTGYEQMTLDQVRNFRQMGAITAGHPEYGHVEGVETTTGPLGQGIATAVGFAIAEEAMRAEYGDSLCDHRTWVIAGDGCLMEGISHEAIALAGHQKLGRLIVMWDNNDITIDGRVSLSDSTDQHARFAAAGWRVLSCDGHDAADIDRALTEAAKDDGRPVLVDCKTIIGFGSPNKSDTNKVHGSPLGKDEITATRAAYGWDAEPFQIPDAIMTEWRKIGQRGAEARKAWNDRVDALSGDHREEFARRIGNDTNPKLEKVIAEFKAKTLEEKPKLATRKASENALGALNAEMPENFGGSADLTGSNNTKTGGQGVFAPDNRMGRYLHYGIREHGMAAAMNGIWLHGGFRPYGGTFMTFTDYARGAMRLSALMGLRVVYVLTHDSIGLGEDGPTHQPVEHLASLRAMPNMQVFRPADAVETLECWQLALESRDAPSVLALSRQNLPTLRLDQHDENKSARGAYEISSTSGDAEVTIYATGSEVQIALAASTILEADGIPTRVVSVPCFELFDRQSPEYRSAMLDNGGLKVAIEAGVRQGWDHFVGRNGIFIGMDGFGASGPASELYEHFGITTEAVVAAVRARLAPEPEES